MGRGPRAPGDWAGSRPVSRGQPASVRGSEWRAREPSGAMTRIVANGQESTAAGRRRAHLRQLRHGAAGQGRQVEARKPGSVVATNYTPQFLTISAHPSIFRIHGHALKNLKTFRQFRWSMARNEWPARVESSRRGSVENILVVPLQTGHCSGSWEERDGQRSPIEGREELDREPRAAIVPRGSPAEGGQRGAAAGRGICNSIEYSTTVFSSAYYFSRLTDFVTERAKEQSCQ